MRMKRIVGIGAGLAVVAVAATTGVMALDDEGTTTVTAYFDQATGVYATPTCGSSESGSAGSNRSPPGARRSR